MKQYEHGGNIYQFQKKMLDFSANINPLGMPKSVKKALKKNVEKYEIYPDCKNQELKQAIGEFHIVPEEHIVCGNGAANVIYRIAYALKPRKALIVSPTFCEYEKSLLEVSCECIPFMLQPDFTLGNEVKQAITEDYDIMFLCNPNNPTGIPYKKKQILEIAYACKEKGVMLVIDECFTDFLVKEEAYSITKELLDLEQVIVLKAFTKIYAMAGIRLGYALCSDKTMCQKIEEVMEPWSVSTVAATCGVAALKETDYVEKTKEYVAKNRRYLRRELKELGLKVYPSKANYIFFQGEKGLDQKLLAQGIMIRSCDNYLTLDDTFYRIAVKKKKENKKLIQGIKRTMEA